MPTSDLWKSISARFRKAARHSKANRRQRARLNLETLEDRAVPAGLVYVGEAADFSITNDIGDTGLSAGDTVIWNHTALDHQQGAVTELTFGTDAFTSLQAGINAVDAEGTVFVTGGTYSEQLSITKSLKLIGAISGGDPTTTLTAAVASGDLVTISGAGFTGAEEVEIANFNFLGTAAGGLDYGVRVASTARLNEVSVSNSTFTDFDINGIEVFGDSSNSGISVENVVLTGLTFTDNGYQNIGGAGDIDLFFYNGNASFTDLVLTNSGTGARGSIQMRGVGSNTTTGADILAMGTVSFDNVDISGKYGRYFITFQRYSSVANLSFTDVELGGAASELTGPFGAVLRFDAVGAGTVSSPATVDLGNTYFRGLANASTIPFFIEFAPDNAFTFLRADATNVTWDITPGSNTLSSALTQSQLYQIEDRILHHPDALHPTHGDFNGFAVLVNGNAYVTATASVGSINRAIAAVDANGTVNVAAGVYEEDVNINRDGITLLGQNQFATTISGITGGDSATVRVSANNVTVAGFTITRNGNNTTDWNDAGLNSAGVAFQGTTITNGLIRDNIITGNRTGIDINDSNGHTIRNNVITNNRTGMIMRNQTDNLTVTENEITDNWTVGVLFLDASGGTNSPVQTALGSTFTNNNISGNWYGQVVDRQTGGSLPAPGTSNLKDFSGNWFGTTTPVISTANSAEPGYSALIPVAFGGTATPPGGQPDILGPASANIDITPYLDSGVDVNVETTPGRGVFGFQGNFSVLHVDDVGAEVSLDGKITDAISYLPGTGGTIKIHSGTYTENVDTTTTANVILSPGASPGSVTLNGNLTLDSNDTLRFELNGPNAGTDYDQFIVNGQVNLGGATLVVTRGFSPSTNAPFVLIDSNTAILGQFNGLSEGEVITIAGAKFKISYAGTDVTLTPVSVAPGAPLTYTDDDGDVYSVKLKGPGSFIVTLDDADSDGRGSISSIVLSGTSATQSQLSITLTKRGSGSDREINIGSITGTGLKSISAKNSNLVGAGINLTDSLGSLDISDVLFGADIITGNTTALKTTITADLIGAGSDIDIGTPIEMFTADAVADGATLTAPSINKLRIAGDFNADLDLSGNLTSGRIGGGISGSNWEIDGSLATLAVSGLVDDWGAHIAGVVNSVAFRQMDNARITTDASVNKFKAETFRNSYLYAGYTPLSPANPMAGGDFVANLKIGSFSVFGKQVSAFSDSTIAADSIGKVDLTTVRSDNTGTYFGVIADETIQSVRVKSPFFRYNLGDPTPAGFGRFQVIIDNV